MKSVRELEAENAELRERVAKLEAALNRATPYVAAALDLLATIGAISPPEPPEETGQIWDAKFGAAG